MQLSSSPYCHMPLTSHLILFTRTTNGEDYSLWDSQLCSFWQVFLASCVLSPYIFLSSPFSNSHSLISPHNIRDQSYVYWTVHHLGSWIKIDQLDVTCFIISLFPAQHISNVSTSIFRSLRLTVDLFHVLYCSGSMCVGVTVWFGWGGVVSVCRLKD